MSCWIYDKYDGDGDGFCDCYFYVGDDNDGNIDCFGDVDCDSFWEGGDDDDGDVDVGVDGDCDVDGDGDIDDDGGDDFLVVISWSCKLGYLSYF